MSFLNGRRIKWESAEATIAGTPALHRIMREEVKKIVEQKEAGVQARSVNDSEETLKKLRKIPGLIVQ